MQSFKPESCVNWRISVVSKTVGCTVLALLTCFACAANEIVRPPQTVASAPDSQTVVAADPDLPLFSDQIIARTTELANDARLNDVWAVGSKVWAVGERGVIVRSADSGQTWQTHLFPFECSLQSVCFLTDRIGFVAGFRVDAVGNRVRAVLLRTRDAGDTWTSLTGVPLAGTLTAGDLSVGRGSDTTEQGRFSGSQLTGLRSVRFFDLQNGFVVTQPSPYIRSQVLKTVDGGQTWTALPSDTDQTTWKGAAFVSINEAVVYGDSLTFGAVVSDRIVGSGQPQQTLRSINNGILSHDGTGWLVGDGGIVLTSSNRGISWTVPQIELPQDLSQLINLNAVAQSGSTVCLAGSPGSLILRSPDSGLSWSIVQTQHSLPIRDLCTVGNSEMIAVGDLGSILRSSDSGQTWSVVRNLGYRSAALCLTTEPTDVSLPMLASVSANEGFRSVVLQPSVAMSGRKGSSLPQEVLTAAVSWLGCSSVESDWAFPRSSPQQHHVRDQLLAEWNRNTDGNLNEILPLRLARAIRIWRPDVITIEQTAADDQVSQIWAQAIDSAIAIARGDGSRADQLSMIGLQAWSVERTLIRTRESSRSTLAYDSQQLLSSLGSTPELVCSRTRSLWSPFSTEPSEPQTDSYRVADHQGVRATPRHMFAGIQRSSSADCRRRMTIQNTPHMEKAELALQQYRTGNSALIGHTHHLNSEVSLIGQVRRIGQGLPDKLAMRQLWNLADLHQTHENLEGQISVLQEITRRFPGSADAAAAAQNLFAIYSSTELRTLRMRDNNARSNRSESDSEVSPLVQVDSQPGSVIQETRVQQASAVTFGSVSDSDRRALEQRWNQNAKTAYDILQSIDPESAASSRNCLRQAANLARQGVQGEHFSLLARAAEQNDAYAMFARAEQHAIHGANLTPIPVFNLPQSGSKPFLDSVLDDACWQNAEEIRLRSGGTRADRSQPDCLVMLAWDSQYLYIAARVERVDTRAVPPEKLTDRHHDADHGVKDRVEILLDVDRDYSTGYQFTIDETGQGSDQCAQITRWNPVWHIANDGDQQVWRFEAAIPVSEINDTPLRAGTLWSVRLRRIVPGYLEQTLAAEVDAEDNNGYGLVRFIRSR